MNTYKCIVYDENRSRQIIKIEAESKIEINKYIIKNKLKLVSSKKVYNKKINVKLSYNELTILCKQFAILIESGCELTNILSILANQSNKKLHNILINISNQIQIGNSISEAFQHTKLFSNFFISMLKAGEISGNLDSVMYNLSDYYNKENKLRSKITGILIYPAILIITSILVMLFMMVKIIPSFADNFLNQNIELPAMTKILVDISMFTKNNFLFILLFNIIALVVLSYNIFFNSKVKYIINKLKLRFLITRKISKLIVANRFSRSLHILSSSGLRIIDAIEISSKVIDNEFVDDKILSSIDCMIRGYKISDALKITDIFPNTLISMINIGEESGKLDSILATMSKLYDDEIDRLVDKFMRLLEPCIMLIIGIFVGIGILVMVTPMFDLINNI